MYQPRLNIAYTGSAKDALKGNEGNSDFAFMSMSKAQLNASFTAAYLGEDTLSDGTRTFHLRLTPVIKTGYKLAELWIDVDGMLRQSRKIAKNDDSTTILLTKLEKNISLVKANFRVSPRKGTKIQPS